MRLSKKINSNSASSLKMTKTMISNISNLSAREAVEHCISLNTISRSTEDFKKGIDTFLNKDK